MEQTLYFSGAQADGRSWEDPPPLQGAMAVVLCPAIPQPHNPNTGSRGRQGRAGQALGHELWQLAHHHTPLFNS